VMIAACPFCSKTNQLSSSIQVASQVIKPQEHIKHWRRSHIRFSLVTLYLAMIFIFIGIVTPGWRKIEYSEYQRQQSTQWDDNGGHYVTSIGIGFYKYVTSSPGWVTNTNFGVVPVVGEKGTREPITVGGNCFNSYYTWLSPSQCSTYNVLQGLSIPTLILSVIFPLVITLANGKKWTEPYKISSIILGILMYIFIIIMFIVSEQVGWSNLNPDPSYSTQGGGGMSANHYAFSYAFFCLGLIGYAFVTFLSLLLCMRKIN